MTEAHGLAARFGEFAVTAVPPADARVRAAAALLDTCGVMLAGVPEPASAIVRDVITTWHDGECSVLGTDDRASATDAALANGTAAHALDFDDMCFVSLAHPSAPLVAAILAAGELARSSGRALLEAYVVAFEIEARLGTAMNPRHYERGWHCTSTLGTVGAAAACARLLGLDAAAAGHAIAIAASEACGLKENFGTMVKPLHAGLAAKNAVLAARLAQAGMTASAIAIEGPQGYLRAFDAADPGSGLASCLDRWEIVETGITVKLYPSCAGTHPTLDAILDLKRRERLTAADVERIEVQVDSMTPNVLIYERPASGLEGKFSMPFCAAAAVVHGAVGIETFAEAGLADPGVRALMPRVTMRVDPALDGVAAPLTQARVTIALRDGRTLTQYANGARGYPANPPRDEELDAKFLSCAGRVLTDVQASRALGILRDVERLEDTRALTHALGT